MFNALELLIVVAVLGVLVAGLARRWNLPGLKRSDQRHADWAGLAGAVFGQRRIRERTLVGVAHLCLVWGFVLFVLIVILAQTPLHLPSAGAYGVSLLLDLIGVCMLVATLVLIIRRISRWAAKSDSRPPKRVVLPMGMLLIILLSGFFAEGARINLVQFQNPLSAPVGWLLSNILPASPQFMQAMIRVHFVFVVLFVGSIPFTFMRHLGSTAVHLLYKRKDTVCLPTAVSLDRGPLGVGTVLDLSEQQLREAEACVSCGRCDENCPALISGKPLSPRAIMGKIVDQMEALPRKTPDAESNAVLPQLASTVTADELWACTTCLACVTHCPAAIRPMDKIIEMRRWRTMDQAQVPGEAIPMMRDVALFGDVNGKGRAHRADWAFDRDVRRYSQQSAAPEVLLWVGCSGAFHPEYLETTRALVRIMRAGGIDFGILAQDELCCGDPARKLGDEALFIRLAQQNIARFNQYGIRRIVTLCPHCFNALGSEYRALGFEGEVIHAVQMAARLIDQGKIHLKYPFSKSVAIHDPCYLGRYNGIYEPLRRVCDAVPGVDLTELQRHGEKGFCCGGGGGRMWLHETIGENINTLRAREVLDAQVEAVATACPYCLTMMEEGVKALETDNPPQVIDIIRLVAESLG